MLTPEQLAQIADTATVRKLYDQLQEDIIADMARRISEMDFASYTTMWELQRLEAINAERDYIVQRACRDHREKQERDHRHSEHRLLDCALLR